MVNFLDELFSPTNFVLNSQYQHSIEMDTMGPFAPIWGEIKLNLATEMLEI
jgi:hypothetical protein